MFYMSINTVGAVLHDKRMNEEKKGVGKKTGLSF